MGGNLITNLCSSKWELSSEIIIHILLSQYYCVFRHCHFQQLTDSVVIRECKPGPFFLTPGFGFLQHQNPGPRGWLMTMQNLAFLEYTHHTSMARNRLRSKCAESTCRRTNRPRRCCSVSVRLTSDLLVTPGFDAVKTRNPGSEKNGPGLHSLLSN